MQQILDGFTEVSLSPIQKTVFTTTLYELVEAVNEEVQPEELGLVPEIVIGILNTYRSNCRVQ